MSRFPSLPLFTDAFISDTMHLSAAETGAYLMLLMVAWRSPGCRLPDDDQKLARWARVDARYWPRTKQAVMAFWTLEDGHWTQKRLLKEHVYCSQLAETARANGARGGRPKSLKTNNTGNPAGSPRVTQNITQTKAPNPIRREDTLEANASNGADAPQRPSDPVELLWSEGPPALTAMGSKEREARSCIGRWLRDTGGNADLVLGAILRARDLGTRDPVPLVSRILKPMNGHRARSPPERARTVHDVARDLEARFARPDDDEFDLLPGIRQQAH